MKVLVTGAGSLLLGGIAQQLAERGDHVVCFQRRTAETMHQSITMFAGDIRDRGSVSEAASGCDAIIHGAARVGVMGSWEEFQSTNVDGTSNILRAATEHQISRLVYVSTPSVAHVGDAIEGDIATPAMTGRKRAYYAESKAQAEILALQANGADLGVVAIRPHLVWGPGDTQLVGRIVERARQGRLVMVGSGNALVDSTYIDNAISAHIAALDAVTPGSPCAGKAYVISNGEPRTVNELMSRICDAAGVEFSPKHVPAVIARNLGSLVERLWPVFRKDEPPITRFVAEQLGTAHWFDQRPAQKDLNWKPQVSVDEGFARLTDWFQAQQNF
jgi:nucleoside-diphosphate-sugar epimerase